MGRHSKFNAALTAKIAALYGSGKTDIEVAKAIGVSPRTLYYWKHSQPDFLQALNTAKDVADDLIESSLFRRATGYTHPEEKIFCFEGYPVRVKTYKHYPPDVTAQIFWLKNRRPEDWRETQPLPDPENTSPAAITPSGKKSFAEFCEIASYPKPYPKQLKFREFAIDEIVPRLLLGARGYGKTDYAVIMGLAYEIYLNPLDPTTLIITKSKERNAAMLTEIATACKANGVVFEKENASCIRAVGLIGKDHTVSAVTIKTVTLRGRHPKRVILDDPVTEDDTSDATRLLVEKKYNEVMKLVNNVLIIGQPAHKFDLYAKLRGLVKTLEAPHGTIPELDHDLEAQRLAGVDEASISASYHLKILAEGTTPFDGVKYLDKYPIGDSVAFIDPSHEGGDYTAVSIVRSYLAGIAVVGFTYKKAWNHCLDDMLPALKKFQVRKLAIETNGLGSQPVDMLRDLLAPHGIGVVGRRSNNNKHSRIMSAGTYAHLIHLSRESSKVYLDQVVQYEYKAKFDDAPDSLATCLEWIGLIRGKI